MNGILNILKPTGMTSHDVVSSVRKILGTKKIGHAGTLDPNVAGVLVICVEKGTKISEYLMNGDKEYMCELILGSSTDTQDSYGKTKEKREIHYFSREEIERTLQKFEGEQLQVPPAFSAVKFKGRKLYEYARENIVVEKPGKLVDIKKIEIVDFKPGRILMKIKCSKGTYMRTLCNDIGEELGTLGHMGILVRTEAKGLEIEDSITLEELRFLNDNNRLDKCLIPIEEVFPLKKVNVDDSLYDKVVNGNDIPVLKSDIKDIGEESFYIYCRKTLIGIGYKNDKNRIKIDKLLM
jgi:tRNA pseudouridine55 synthase